MNDKKTEQNNSYGIKSSLLAILDADKDGKLEIEDIIAKSLAIPGIAVSRDRFLVKELSKRYSMETVEKAIAESPYKAGVSLADISEIAESAIKYERCCVSGISAVLSIPTSFSAFASVITIPADVLQYYAYMLRAAQKMLYLYGFPSLTDEKKKNEITPAAMNMIILCLGTMYCIAGAKNGLLAVAKAIGTVVEKELMEKELTTGFLYPVVVQVSKALLRKQLSEEAFAQFFGKAIPVVGGAVGGAVTYISFKPCCDRLKSALEEIMLMPTRQTQNVPERVALDTSVSPTAAEEEKKTEDK